MSSKIKENRRKKSCLTESDKDNIKKLLFRGLREGEKVVDNRAVTIAKELDLPITAVFHYMSKI